MLKNRSKPYFEPGSIQSVRILSLTDYQNGAIWKDNNQTRVGVKGITTSSNLTRRTYVWDLHTLADSYFSTKTTLDSIGGTFCQIPSDNSLPWKNLWVAEFNDNAGGNTYYKLPTPFAVSAFNQPMSDQFLYSGSLTCQPLISLYPDATVSNIYTNPIDGIVALYNLSLIPGSPFFVTTSVSNNQSYGPNFIEGIRYSVEGADAITPVNITVNWKGGKSVVCQPVISADQYPQIIETSTQLYNHYRTAALMDCLSNTEASNTGVTNLQNSLVNVISNENSDPQARITGMDLSIKQKVSFNVTMPKNHSVSRSIEQGPRFATISEREVTGTIKMFSTKAALRTPTGDEITMYFGGPLIFAMPQIDWQKPEMVLTAGNGYIHILTFIARADDNTTSMYDPSNKQKACSEFIMPQG